MISKTLEDIEKDIKYLKEIANEEHFKKVEEMCNEVNKRNNNLQKRIDKAIEYIEDNDLYEEVIDDLFEENPIYLGANCEKARNDLLNILKGSNK